MKKLIAFLLALVMVVGLVACGAKEETAAPAATEAAPAATEAAPAPAEDVTIVWGVHETDNLTAELYQTIIDAFEADNPGIKIERMIAAGDSRAQFWKTQYASGNFPDIVLIDGGLENIEGLFAEVPADVADLFDPGCMFKTNGIYNCFPYGKTVNSMGCYYNKEIFAQYNLSVPTTYEEFLNVCETLKAAGVTPMMAGGTGDVWATGQPWWCTTINTTIAAAYPDFNQQLLSGEKRFDDPVIVDALKQWQDDIINKGYYFEGAMSYSYSQANAEFLNGAAAMMIDGSWNAAALDALEGFGVFTVPHPDGHKFFTGGILSMGVAAESKVQDACWTFVKWLFTNEEIYGAFLKADGMMSATKVPVNYEAGPVTDELNKAFEGYTAVTSVLWASGDDALPAGMEDECNKILQNVFIGKDPAEQLAALQEQFEQML